MNRWKCLCIYMLLVTGIATTPARAWKLAEGPLATRWTRDVSPEKAWPEYPRPQMMREKWTNLNGLWQYAIQPEHEGKPTNWDGEILVPFPIESMLSGVRKPVEPDQKLWYRRSFSLANKSRDQHTLLHFGAVDWKCTVWINDKKVGEHTGGYDPFTFDITDALRNGANEMVVAVVDPTDTGSQPHGKQVLHPKGIMYTAVTGIWQTVWLEPVPGRHIESLKIVPDIDRGAVIVTVQATSGGTVRVQALGFHVTPPDERTTLVPIVAAEKSGKANGPIQLPLPSPIQRWSPESPVLYDLQIELARWQQGNRSRRKLRGNAQN